MNTPRPAGRFPHSTRRSARRRAIAAVLIAACLALPSGRRAGAAEPSTQPAGRDGRLLLNFQNASVQAVLEYLSEAAGLVVIEGGRLEGRITIVSRQPMTIDEAVALLDTILKEKGYAAIRTGRTLKIVPIEEAVRENLPVYSGSDPSKVPIADRLVTQVIPIRHADATKLKTDLASLVGSGATLTANQASNSLILIDTQTNIRRIMQIIQALDAHMAGVAEVKIYQLKYADATNTSRLITELFQQDQNQRQAQDPLTFFRRFRRGRRGGRGDNTQGAAAGGRQQKVIAAADERTNTLVISAPPDLLQVIDGVVKELDSDPTEEQSVFIYALKNAQAKNLETVLNNIFSETTTTVAGRTTAGRTTRGRTTGRNARNAGRSQPNATAAAGDMAGQVYVVADEDTNSLLVRTATKYVQRIRTILGDLDRPVPQVLIKVLIAEVTHDGELDLGMEFSVLNLNLGASGAYNMDLGGTAERKGGLVTATLDGGLSAVINALQRDGRLDVLSRPYILASDNKEAKINIGQELPRVASTRVSDSGSTISDLEYKEIGITLTVTPHVNPDGLVIMDVNPVISNISDTTVPVTEGILNAVVLATRSAQTQVAVRDGQTIVIGGLMEDRISESVQKVPGLGDIPLLGRLFQRTRQTKVKTELLVFLTPRVAKQPKDLKAISRDETKGIQAVRQAGGNGAFQEHLKAMRGAATSRPAGGKRDARP